MEEAVQPLTNGGSIMFRYTINDTTEIIEGQAQAQVDIAVLVVFFNRPDMLRKVFDQIRKAKPSKLLLYQDGPRSGNEQDIEKGSLCRDVVAHIDWNCTVHRFYQESNFGCNPSMYIAQKWAFSKYDKCVVLEDDEVPAISFFGYCKELLDRYENDKRIYRICGSNVFGEYAPYDGDYFYTRGGSITGWASWKRVIDEYDENYSFMKDQKIMDTIAYTYKDAGAPVPRFLNNCKAHIASGREHFESLFSAARILGGGYSIVPTKNLISNIGISVDSTHGGKDIRLLSKNMRKFFNAEIYEIELPLRHPQFFIEDKKYEDEQSRFMGWRKSIFRKAVDYIGDHYRELRYSR
jgi:hypothetical protein